jgi:sensor histidine kinase regulating citrate/malate metabolism
MSSDNGRSGDRAARAVSMRLVIGLAAVGLVVVTILTVGGVAEHNARDSLTAEVEARVLLEARNLALAGTDALLAEFPELTLCPLVTEMTAHRDDLESVVVLDRDGRIQADVDAGRLGEAYTGFAGLRSVASRQPLRDGERLLDDAHRIVAAVPVTLRDGQRLGTAVVALKRAYLDRQVTRSRRALACWPRRCWSPAARRPSPSCRCCCARSGCCARGSPASGVATSTRRCACATAPRSAASPRRSTAWQRS